MKTLIAVFAAICCIGLLAGLFGGWSSSDGGGSGNTVAELPEETTPVTTTAATTEPEPLEPVTVTPETLLEGITAYNSAGEIVVGTLVVEPPEPAEPPGVKITLDGFYLGNGNQLRYYLEPDDPDYSEYMEFTAGGMSAGMTFYWEYPVGKPLGNFSWTDPYSGNCVTLNGEVVDLKGNDTILQNGDELYISIYSFP